jgi:hypothetical protein
MIKALKKVGLEGMYLNIIKAIYDKPYSQYHTKQRKSETISSKVRSETRVSMLPTLIQYSFGISNQS